MEDAIGGVELFCASDQSYFAVILELFNVEVSVVECRIFK